MTYLFLKRLPSPFPKKKHRFWIPVSSPRGHDDSASSASGVETEAGTMSCGGWGWTPRRWDFCSYYRHNRCFYTPNIEDVPSQTVFWWIVQKKQKMLCFFLISSFFCSWVFVCFENKSHVISPFIALMMSFPIDWTFLHRPCTDHWQVVGRTASSSSIWSQSFKITAKIGRLCLCTYIHRCISAQSIYRYIYVHKHIYMYIYIYRWSKYFSIYYEYTTCAYLIIYIYYIVYVLCVASIFQEKSLDCESDPFDSLSKELHDQVENDGQTRWNLLPPRWWSSFPAKILAEKYKKKSP